jgi:hypothetical protein
VASTPVLAFIMSAPRRPIEPAICYIAPMIKPAFDTIAAVRSFSTHLVGIGILSKRRSADNGQSQSAGRNQISLSHRKFSLNLANIREGKRLNSDPVDLPLMSTEVIAVLVSPKVVPVRCTSQGNAFRRGEGNSDDNDSASIRQ